MKLVDLSNPIALATIIANSNANSIPVNATGTAYASQAEGFPHITMIPEDNGGEAPHGLDFNGFLKMLSSHVFNIQNGSPETFNPAVSALIGGYPKNAQLWLIDDNNSRLLKSTKDDNTDNFLTTPSVIGTSWVDAFPTKDYVDNNFVTKATAQTITGGKTFIGNLDKQNKDADKGETANNRYWSISCYDKNGTANTNRLSMWQTQITSAGTETALYAYKNESGTNIYTSLKVIYPASGSPYATAPAPTEDTNNSNQIDTVGARNTKLADGLATKQDTITLTASRALISNSSGKVAVSAVTSTELGYLDGVTSAIQTQINGTVKTSGNQTIAGTKTFSSTIHGSINGNAATVTNGVYTTGNQTIGGTKTFSAATYGTASDAANSIVTTVDKSKAANGYFQLGNGLIIQWGRMNTTSTSERTVTFSIPFSSASSYTIVKNYQSDAGTDAQDREVSFYSMTTTSAKTYSPQGDTTQFSWIAIGY